MPSGEPHLKPDTRSIIKEVANTMGIPMAVARHIANLIPEKTPGEAYAIAEALGVQPTLRALVEADPKALKLIVEVMKIQTAGGPRHEPPAKRAGAPEQREARAWADELRRALARGDSSHREVLQRIAEAAVETHRARDPRGGRK
jgi:hypothetical protein